MSDGPSRRRPDPIDPESPWLRDAAHAYRNAVLRADWHARHGTLTCADEQAVEDARRVFAERVRALPYRGGRHEG